MNKWKRKEIKELNSLEYNVIKNNATEPPFQNKYWDNKQPGIYVDIISGEPLLFEKLVAQRNTTRLRQKMVLSYLIR